MHLPATRYFVAITSMKPQRLHFPVGYNNKPSFLSSISHHLYPSYRNMNWKNLNFFNNNRSHPVSCFCRKCIDSFDDFTIICNINILDLWCPKYNVTGCCTYTRINHLHSNLLLMKFLFDSSDAIILFN